jgi:aarF domain-containing kinase
LDTYFYDACLTRSLRTFYSGLVIALDYRLNFRPDPWIGDSVTDLHARSAQRVYDLLRANGGLYLKIGQAIAMQSAVLPPEFQKMFQKMFDDAPQNDWKEVEKVIREDFGGRSVEDVFGVSFTGEPGKGVIERTARASASVAQVHWAKLPDGREVAIKVQKREIRRQTGWDLWAFRVVSRVYSWYFDLPLYHLVPYVCERLMAETNFEFEADNSRKMRQLIQNEPRLSNRVYIPEVYSELSGQRVMTAEWIEGVRLWDKEGVMNSWQGGWRKGSPGAGGAQLPPLPNSVHENLSKNSKAYDEKLKPIRDDWRGADKKGGLGLSFKPVMQTMVDLFSAQMFLWGLVHCDPHPGNIFIRRLPSGKPELVLIDHGLYISMDPKFRKQYALFWRSLMTFDNATIARITRDEWGINAPDLFASATLMRPYEGGDRKVLTRIKDLSAKERRERSFELQQQMQKSVRDILQNQDKFPQELIFIGRNLRIVQGNNQFLGSPVNRIKITGYWASRALTEDREVDWASRWRESVKHLAFRAALVGTDAVFYWAKLRQWLGLGKGMDDELEKGMRKMAER